MKEKSTYVAIRKGLANAEKDIGKGKYYRALARLRVASTDIRGGYGGGFLTGDETDRSVEELRGVSNYLSRADCHLTEKVKAMVDGLGNGRPSRSGLVGKATVTASIVRILGGIFFLSTNITGNAIANVSQSSGNILGVVLLVVGLVAGFFWVTGKTH